MEPLELIGQYGTLQEAIQKSNQLLGMIPREQWRLVVDIDDTLIFDDGRSSANLQVVTFVQELLKAGAKVHLVTARSKEMDRATRNELKRLKIEYTSLDVAPERARANVKTTSEWKYSKRKEYGTPIPISMTIGDQWTDLVRVTSELDMIAFDRKYTSPWSLFKINDGNVTLYGLKLYSP